MNISNVIALLGGVALFLFGMSLMGEGLKRVAGSKLELILWRLSSTPIKGVLLGTAVTSIIQSSSATTVMVVGFVNSNMMKVAQAIGVILGSYIGTSATGWILCLSNISGGSGIVQLLSTSSIAAVTALVGIVLRMFCKSSAKKHVGDILLGFAVMMFGMQAMSGAVSGLKNDPNFTRILTMFSNPFLGILVGIVITAILQSASASVGILQALVITGTITYATALPVIMGMGIGASAPVLLSAVGASKDGKRTSLVYLAISIFGTLVCSLVFYGLNAVHPFGFLDTYANTVGIALTNSLYRIASFVVLFPFISGIEKLVHVLVKDDPSEANDNAEIDRLEERFLSHPSLAIEQSRQALYSMANKARDNLNRALSLLDSYSEDGFNKVEEKESVIDRYEDKLGTYLMKITGVELNQGQSAEVSKFLHTISDFERIADHAVNISNAAKEMHEKKLEFSPDAQRELNVIRSAVVEVVNLAVESFESDDMTNAYRVEPLEETIDVLCDEVKMRHVNRLQAGMCTLNHGFVFNDLLTNYERIGDHCSNIGVAMIELKANTFDPHEYLGGVKTEANEKFNKILQEYETKYAI